MPVLEYTICCGCPNRVKKLGTRVWKCNSWTHAKAAKSKFVSHGHCPHCAEQARRKLIGEQK